MAQFRTIQANFTGGEFAPNLWSRIDIPKFPTGVKAAVNFLLRPQGGVSSRPGTRFVCEIPPEEGATQLLAFEIGPGETYVLALSGGGMAGAGVMRFVYRGGLILVPGSTTATSVSAADPAVFTATGHPFVAGDDVFLDQIDDPDLDGVVLRVVSATANTFTLAYPNGAPVNRGGKAVLDSARVRKVYARDHPYDLQSGHIVRLAQDQAIGYLVNRNYAPRRLRRVHPHEWTLEVETFTPGISPPATVNAVVLTGSGSTTYRYVVSAIAEDTGEESLPSAVASVNNNLTIAGNTNRVSWSAVPGASRYLVYKEDNGVYGFIGGTSALQFDDANISPDMSDTPQQPRNPFQNAGDYPGVGTFFEQRLWLASTENNPGGVWASQTANPRNFGVSSPLKASDAITFRVRANQVVQIEALVPSENLVLFTAGGEWIVRGSQNEEFLTPTNLVLRPRTFRGSAAVPPLLIGDLILHAQLGGTTIRDFKLDREIVSTDLGLLAQHLFEGRQIVAMAWQQTPNSVVWVVFDDGSLAAMTYMLEHEIWGWSRQELGGEDVAVEDVAVVSEPDGDAVYLLTRRTVGNEVRRFIERLDNPAPPFPLAGDNPIEAEGLAAVPDFAYHVDCGRQLFFDEPVSVVHRLQHLDGETVNVLADGNVVTGLVVEGGRVELPFAAQVIGVGLPYVARLRTLDLDLGLVRDAGSIMGRHKTITEARIRVERSRGMFIAHERGTQLVEWKQRASEPWDAAIDLFTGDVFLTPEWDWTTTGNLTIAQFDPLPLNINAILLDWELSE